MQMHSVIMKLGTAAFLALAASGCVMTAGAEQAESEALDSVSEAQIDPGYKAWRLYTATFSNGQPLFQVLAIGGSSVGNYQANTEYFSVTTANLQYLGQSNVTFSRTDGYGTPPSHSGSQQFQMPLSSSWTSFSTDPVSGEYRYDSGDVHLRIGTGNGKITRLTWYQTLPTGQSPANITPNGTFTAGSGAVTVPSGSAGYYADSTFQ
ncbi:hypothetical protein BE21_25945 [Sorangium cellulosum]|uniref:Secreted protein n=1 Tax=Sorangium cellulosum TaxID=56 RepID=A0A150TTR0_SORCE|nr:hypothetical protein BE21_25945 [Sorangium cellulosum]